MAILFSENGNFILSLKKDCTFNQLIKEIKKERSISDKDRFSLFWPNGDEIGDQSIGIENVHDTIIQCGYSTKISNFYIVMESEAAFGKLRKMPFEKKTVLKIRSIDADVTDSREMDLANEKVRYIIVETDNGRKCHKIRGKFQCYDDIERKSSVVSSIEKKVTQI